MMKVYVFCGPTISNEDAAAVLCAEYLPPASQGDVYRVALRRPTAIGLIDGYFHQAPSVWHKEIVWAIKEGIRVYGSASIGALRAAELAAFGMRGVGRIFDDFAAGRLEDDDEVALLLGPAETGYRALSEPLVSIRATLAAAERAAVIDAATGSHLVQIAKAMHYKVRSYGRLIDEARLGGVAEEALDNLTEWLPTGRVDQKRMDAVEMLAVMRADLSERDELGSSSFVFEHTRLWDNMARAACLFPTLKDVEEEIQTGVIEELRLVGDAFEEAVAGGLLRHLLLAEARRAVVVTEAELRQAGQDFRRQHGLSDEGSVSTWREANALDEEGFAQLIMEEAQLRLVRSRYGADALYASLNHLRTIGEFAPRAVRAREKRRLLKDCGSEPSTLERLGLSVRDLVQWYVRNSGCLLADGDALVRYASADPSGFTEALLREYAYVQLAQKKTKSE